MTKKAAIALIILLALLSLYFGAYLPFAKGRRFISALRGVATVKTVAEFAALYDKAILFYSPIGDEEVRKFLGIDILNSLTLGNNEPLDRALVDYVESYMLKDDTRHLIILGQMHSVLWKKYGRVEDYALAEKYLRDVLAIGPNLPPALYGLLEIYQLNADNEKLLEVAREIVKHWPQDEGVQKIVRRLGT